MEGIKISEESWSQACKLVKPSYSWQQKTAINFFLLNFETTLLPPFYKLKDAKLISSDDESTGTLPNAESRQSKIKGLILFAKTKALQMGDVFD